MPVVAVETGSSFPVRGGIEFEKLQIAVAASRFEPELITATNFFELSLTRAIGNSPPELKGDPAIAVSLPEAAVRVKALMLLLPLLAT